MDGSLMAVTPNYSWPVPVNTDYVKDGADAIKDLGDAIDATVYGLPAGGLTLIKTTTFSAVASQNLNSIFSSTYDNYKIIFSELNGSVNAALLCRVGVAGTPVTAGYIYGGWVVNLNGATGTESGNNLTSVNINAITSNTANNNAIEITIFNPNKASKATTFNYQGYDTFNNRLQVGSAKVENTSAVTDFQILPASGTITGKVSVYGYAK
jgi:hypothetical protein